MKKSLRKDTFREIKRSFSRFLSIFVIVFLGCGFYAGINATMPDMQLTAEEYFDDNNLMDIRLVSTIGIRAEDIASVKRLDCVEGVMAGYSKDVFFMYENQNLVLKMMSWNGNKYADEDNLNHLVLIEGRLPEKPGECVVDQKFLKNENEAFEIGKNITITSSSSDESIYDTFETDTFEVVGVVTSPLYIGYERDKTSVGNGTVYGFVYVLEEDFASDYYSEMFVTLKDCDYPPFSDEYLDRVELCEEEIVSAFTRSVNGRYDELFERNSQRISSSEQTVAELEEILELDVLTLNVLKTDCEDLIAQYESELADGGGNLTQIKLTQAQSKLSQLEALIEAKANNDTETIDGLYTQLDAAKAEIEAARQELESVKDPTVLNYNRYASSDYGSFDGDSQKIHSISQVFPAFFIIVAALVCLTTMTRMVEEQRVQIGTYKALGYSTLQIASKYLIYGVSAAAAGSFLGTLLGVMTLPVVIYNCYKILYNIPELITPLKFDMALICMLVSVVLVGATVIYSCYKELVAQPSQLMRPKAPKIGKRVLLERFPKIWNKLGFIAKVTLRNLLRYKKRFFMTVFGIAGCTALILTGFALKHSISAIMDMQFDNILKYSGIGLVNVDEFSPEDCKSAVEGVEGIEDVLLLSQVNGEVKNENEYYSVNLIVVEDVEEIDKYVDLKYRTSGKKIALGNDGVIITEKLSQLMGLEKGDEITVDLEEQGKIRLEISDVTENYAMHYIYISPSLYEKTVEKPVYNACFFNLEDGFSNSDVSAELVAKNEVLGVTFLSDNGTSFQNSLDSLTGIVWLLIGCAGLLAMVVLYNLANINITERIREIATIKVLGFYDGETSAYIYRENIVSAVIGIIFGWVLGIFLHKFVVRTAEVDVVMFERSVAWWAYAFSALLTVVFTLIINVILHFKLKKVDMVESLKSVE